MIGVNSASHIIISVEGYRSNKQFLDNSWDDIGLEARQRMAYGLLFTDEDYEKALLVRKITQKKFKRDIFSNNQFIIAPAPALKTPTIEETKMANPKDIKRVSDMIYTWLYFPSVLGLPSVVVPAGKIDGLPIGIQIIGQWGQDFELLAFAQKVERALK